VFGSLVVSRLAIAGRFNARKVMGSGFTLGLRYGLHPPETVFCLQVAHTSKRKGDEQDSYVVSSSLLLGRMELACGSQAFIATLLFDPSMSALPIIPKQNSVSVGLFTH
jgi:hypothetical protein